MVTRRAFLVMLGSAGAAGVGVAAGARLLPDDAAEDAGYPLIRYGEEPCAHCGMMIDDARFAAAWTTPGGDMHFDDIGCMAAAAAELSPGPGTQMYVHDYWTEAWLDAEAATYVATDAIRTPMAFGLVACEDTAAAESLARRVHGETARWKDLPHHLDAAGQHGQGHRS